jgi:hypothetical protein
MAGIDIWVWQSFMRQFALRRFLKEKRPRLDFLNFDFPSCLRKIYSKFWT